ncbi:hypothetical protein [Streptomonospora litoralis]|uniref:Uncharacterized protein n=1 Tax=Streptomonospora litoralis TaxID=2498135 RepID=A0A4P6Q7I1_9ACTN|nr:hypothetical protein [Streptomonospora litoralis]QBI56663.1 hypothetical protein EKD16_24595 [Streptomonospora litoralis]
MRRAAVIAGTTAVLAALTAACGGGAAGTPSPTAAPSPTAPTQAASISPEAQQAATQEVCAALTKAEEVRKDSDTPAEAAAAFTLETDAHTRSLEEGVDPGLHAIAEEHLGDSEAAAPAMRDWCADNTPAPSAAAEGQPPPGPATGAGPDQPSR